MRASRAAVAAVELGLLRLLAFLASPSAFYDKLKDAKDFYRRYPSGTFKVCLLRFASVHSVDSGLSLGGALSLSWAVR